MLQVFFFCLIVYCSTGIEACAWCILGKCSAQRYTPSPFILRQVLTESLRLFSHLGSSCLSLVSNWDYRPIPSHLTLPVCFVLLAVLFCTLLHVLIHDIFLDLFSITGLKTPVYSMFGLNIASYYCS